MSTDQVTPERIMQMAWGYAPPLIMEAALRHRVFDILDAGPKTVQEVAQSAQASVRGLTAIMNALVGLNLLAKDAQNRYTLTPESAAFLVSTKPAFSGGMIRHCSQHLIPKWLGLNEVVTSGKPLRAVNQEQDGAEFFHKFVEDIFNLSYAPARQLAQHLLAQGKLAAQTSVLDLAAGSGVWGIALAQSSDNIQVTAVDWPDVTPVTRKIVHRFGLTERFRFVEGDLHNADFGTNHHIATLGHILHSEGAEFSRTLLHKTFAALASGGTIAIAEFLVNDQRTEPPMGLIFAVNMLVNTEQGDTFSVNEINAWLHEAGFTNPRTLDAPGPSPLILATKP